MKHFLYIISIVILSFSSCKNQTALAINEAITIETLDVDYPWKAQWIGAEVGTDTVNTWINFRKEIDIKTVSNEPVIARIAVDSKYWLWINGELVVFEGGLKRGPTPQDTYYDKVNITPHLKAGKNTLAVLAWYFGKEGFSHKSSGKAGMVFDVQTEAIHILSDTTWKAWLHPAYGETNAPHPNYRLPESNVAFDARKGNFDFTHSDFDDTEKPNAIIFGTVPISPWNNLVQRQIPQWKDFGLKPFKNAPTFPLVSTGDTIKVRLPYNAQITPYFEVDAEEGLLIEMLTDNYRGGGPPNVRAEYTTTKGGQSYESFGWMNGETMYYVIPKGVKILDLKYRETGYNTEFSGSFECDDDFYNRLWQKSLRTLYVTMRDNYMDCPDRERAQWWGDEVLESGEAFYALSPSSNKLVKKGILELMHWQRKDSTIYSPIPAGNWHQELPTQMLSSIGTYGFWNYYWHTNDKETIAKVYDKVEKYLVLWKLHDNGTVVARKGGWKWGDWGENKDMPILFNTQYYMALDSFYRMSELLGESENASATTSKMEQFKKDFNAEFWNGTAYRSSEYKGKIDDRSQGLAVVSGLANAEKYEAILKILKEEKHSSPYMEKYVLEAIFQMGYPNEALQRMQERFSTMVNHPDYTTLWEGWGIGAAGFGGGTTNHAWSGGGLTLLSQYVAGVFPTSAGYDTFQIKPQLGFLKNVNAVVPSIKGNIEVEIDATNGYELKLKIPKHTKAKVYVPSAFKEISVDDKAVPFTTENEYHSLELTSGNYHIKAN
ncbi:alpha-L-rhamnosidase C-terminal domain-containing protein [Algibacter sp. 2305UL17-15]|uniref:alpha-L-rhamnosidase-related protein n=1 Tax=Algibacter sp. 2305UL17-15 TaxID=3231268 RepID=UPI003458DEC3